MSKLTEKQSPVALDSQTNSKLLDSARYIQTLIRNRASRAVAFLRRSPALQPLHRRYGPIKYNYVLPAFRRIKKILRLSSRVEIAESLSYPVWTERCERFRYNREKVSRHIEAFDHRPIISIILPVYNTEPEHLRQCMNSVMNQYYREWELCICDDASTATHIREMLDEYAVRDARIKVVFSEKNGGIASASNRALRLATGEFIGLLDHDDLLTPDALYEVAATLQETDADLIYSDEDRFDSDGRLEPRFKPAWSPDLLLSCMYLAHFCVYRKSIFDQIEGFREGFDGSQDYDLALRFTERTAKIAHIPKTLYHWRKVSYSASALTRQRPAVIEAGRRAIADALKRRQIEGEVENDRVYGFYRVRRKIKTPSRVSIIIPTRDGLKRLRRLIESIESKTDYSDYEIIILDNGSRKAAMLDYLTRSPHRILRHDAPFNFSRLNNLAAARSGGEYLLFLNDDTEVINREWMSAMVEQAQRREVGAVGAKLLYKDGRIQHAGVILGVNGAADHAHRLVDGFSGSGYLNYPNVIRNYSAVTAACLMMRRTVFDEAGGFDEEHLPVSYNDIDLCLRLRERGYLIVCTPYALLYHEESATRGLNLCSDEEARLIARWRSEIMNDFYYNPNLTSTGEAFRVDFSKPDSLACAFESSARLGDVIEVGQEFSIDQNDLCAIALRLDSALQVGSLRLRLRDRASSESDIAVADIELSRERDDGRLFFHFDPVGDSAGRRFRFFIEIVSDGLNDSGGRTAIDAGGLRFIDHIEAQLSFRVYTLKRFRYAASSV